MLAHNAAVLEMAVNPADIYDPADLQFLDWLELVIDRVHASKQEAERKSQQQGG